MTATASESSPPKIDPKRSKWVANVTKFIVTTPSSGRSVGKVESGRDRASESVKIVSECENSKHQRSSCVSKSGSTKPNSKTSSIASTTSKSQRHEIVIVTCAPYVTTSEQTSSRDAKRCKQKKNEHCPVNFRKPKNIPPCSYSEEDSSQQSNPPCQRTHRRRHEKPHHKPCSPISSSRESTPCTLSSKRPDDTTQATSSCWSLSHTISTKSIWNDCVDSLSNLDDNACPLSRVSYPTKERSVKVSTASESEEKNAPKSPDEVKAPPDPPLGLARPASPSTDGHFVTCFPQYDEYPRNTPLPPWLDPNYQDTEPESEAETVVANESTKEETPELPKTSPPEYNPWHEMADSKSPYVNLPTWNDDFPGGLPYDQCHMEFPTDESQFI